MKRVVAAAFFLLLPAQGFAKDQLKKFRWAGGGSAKPQIYIGTSFLFEPKLLQGVGEKVASGAQEVGGAKVENSWRQGIYKPDGSLSYSAGEVAEGLPSVASLKSMEVELADGLRIGMESLPELRGSSRTFPAVLHVHKDEKGLWVPYWRVDYLNQAGDRLHYAHIARDGTLLETGELEWDGADGRALVFPKGPKLSAAQEEPLTELVGDGTVSGRLIKVLSALDLKVWSPELTFFFNQNDRRFDLGQAYYTISQGFRWLKEHLGVELDHPVEVRLHVGNGGVSNAAFYHQNTIYLGTGDGVTYKEMIRDPSILVHESIHAIVDAYAGLPSEGEGGGFNEGFADLFAGLILENPRMGEASYQLGPFRRTLENNLVAYRDFGPGVYQNGSIVGGTFWDMKDFLGTELTAKLAFRTLVRLGKGARFDDFPAALASAAEGILSPEQRGNVMAVAAKRGWRVP